MVKPQLHWVKRVLLELILEISLTKRDTDVTKQAFYVFGSPVGLIKTGMVKYLKAKICWDTVILTVGV